MAGVELSTECFRDALNDYFYLLNQGYPERPSLKLVGDRYHLSGNQRICLYRGITCRIRAEKRKLKQTKNLENRSLHIDGYNVIFTIMNYLLGKTLFISNDGFVRDSGAVYGKIQDEQKFVRAIRLLFDTLAEFPVVTTTIYLDKTIDDCENHLKIMEREWNPSKKPLSLLLPKQADARLKRVRDGVMATSDSEIIDFTPLEVADISRMALIRTFRPHIFDLNRLLK